MIGVIKMGILSWIIIGGLAGWIASKLTSNDARMGALANIVVGIVGGVLGGWIVSALGGTGVTGFNIYSFLVATFGAIVLLTILRLLRN